MVLVMIIEDEDYAYERARQKKQDEEKKDD